MITARVGRLVAYALFLGCSVSAASVARAQASPAISAPPTPSLVDANGVNLATGDFQISSTDLSIGSPGSSGLAHARNWTGNGWVHGFFLTITTTATTAKVNIGGQTIGFTLSGGVYTPDQSTGATLTATASTFTYTASDGTISTFDRSYASYSYNGTIAGVGTSIVLPSGERITLTYKTSSSPNLVRLQSVNSSSGYQLKYSYSSFSLISQVIAINNAIDYCNPAVDSCTGFTQTWPAVSYSYTTSGSNTLESVADALSRVTRYTTNASGRMIGIKRPSSSTDTTIIAYDTNNRVSSISNGSASWTYSWSISGTTLTGTITGPATPDLLVHQRVTTADTAKLNLLTDTIALGSTNLTTSYGYDTAGRLAQITPPEGTATSGYTSYAYDTRGNLTGTTSVSKTPGTPANISTSATFPIACASQLTCNKPTATIDARGQQTDYTYDATTGLMTSVTAPAPTTGAVRPQTRYSYTALYAYYKNSSGAIVAAANPIYKLTAMSACATTSSCAGGADEVKTTVGYGPQVSGTANNLLPLTSSVGSGDGLLTATTTTVYDVVGNLYTVDGPLSGTADTTRYRYDAVHQLVGLVGPDPDGAGTLKNRAIKLIYTLDGQLTEIDRGTVISQSDADWANFSFIRSAINTYDGLGRKTKDILFDGSSALTLTQYSYDAENRLDCTAVRMRRSDFGSGEPSYACDTNNPSTSSPDRISKNVYDAANRLTSVITGYGSTVQRTDMTRTYTSNGLIATVADGKNNLTTYEYDGFDRLVKSRYPSPTTAGTSSTTDYEQITFNLSSNIIQDRRRDGALISLTYNNLYRLTTKDLPGSESDVSYVYDNIGRLVSAAQAGNALSFSYDALGRTLNQTGPLGTMTSQWDLAGRRIRLTWPDAFYVTYDYLLTDEMTAVRENGATSGAGVLATITYDDLGRRMKLTRGNGTSTSYCYGGTPTAPNCNGGPQALLFTGLALDLSGTAYDQNATFVRDPAQGIIGQSRSNDTYAFKESYNANRNYTVNGLNQYTAAGNFAPSYDARGNLTGLSGASYAYSSENLLTSASGGVSMTYDPAQRLYQTAGPATTRFGYDGSDVIGEYNASNALQRRYVFGPGGDEPIVWYEGAGTTDRRWLLSDERGSVTAVTNGSGNPLAIDAYDEYGTPQTGNLGRFQYTGQMWLPEVGLYHDKARAYSPKLGRFLQTDPIGYAGGMSLYAYAGNDPINHSDPSGNEDEIVVNGDPGGGFGGFDFDPWWFGSDFGDLGANLPFFGGGAGEGSPTGTPGQCEGDKCETIVVTAKKTGTADQLRNVVLSQAPVRIQFADSGQIKNDASTQNNNQCPPPPTPGAGQSTINQNIADAQLDARVNALDPFQDPFGAVQYLNNLSDESFNVTSATSQNYKANPVFRGSAAYGNFNFGATMQARGFSLPGTLRYSNAFQRLTTGRADPPEDVRDVTNGYKYAQNACNHR